MQAQHRRTNWKWLVVFLLAATALVFAPLMAQAAPLAQGETPFDLAGWLRTLTVGGAAVLATALASILAEKSAWWQAKTPDARFYLTMAASAVIGLGSYGVLQLPPSALAAIQPWIQVFIACISPIVGGQVIHALTKPKKAETTIVGSAQNVQVTNNNPPAVGTGDNPDLGRSVGTS